MKQTLIPLLIAGLIAGLYFTLSFLLRNDYSLKAYFPGYLLMLSYLIVKCCSQPLGFNRIRVRLVATFLLYTILICLCNYRLWWSFLDNFRNNDFMHILIIITLTELLYTYRTYFFPRNK